MNQMLERYARELMRYPGLGHCGRRSGGAGDLHERAANAAIPAYDARPVAGYAYACLELSCVA